MFVLPQSSSPEDLIRSGWRLDRLIRAVELARRSLQAPLTEERINEGWTKKRKKFVLDYVERVSLALEEHRLYRIQDYNGWVRNGFFGDPRKTDEWKDVVLDVANTLDGYQEGEKCLRVVLRGIEYFDHDIPPDDIGDENVWIYDNLLDTKKWLLFARLDTWILLKHLYGEEPIPPKIVDLFCLPSDDAEIEQAWLDHEVPISCRSNYIKSLIVGEPREFFSTDALESSHPPDDAANKQAWAELREIVPSLRELAQLLLDGRWVRQCHIRPVHSMLASKGAHYVWFNADDRNLGATRGDFAEPRGSFVTNSILDRLYSWQIPVPWRLAAAVYSNLEETFEEDEMDID